VSILVRAYALFVCVSSVDHTFISNLLIQLCDEFSFEFQVLRRCDVIMYGAALGAVGC
jgi:hypothetical protein